MPSPGPDPGLNYGMNKLVLRLARLRDLEEAQEEGKSEEEECLVDPGGVSKEVFCGGGGELLPWRGLKLPRTTPCAVFSLVGRRPFKNKKTSSECGVF